MIVIFLAIKDDDMEKEQVNVTDCSLSTPPAPVSL